MRETSFSLNKLHLIGCDCTVTNMGWKTDVTGTIEEQVRRLLQWGVCLLHLNELPFQHLFKAVDDETSKPKLFIGPIDTLLRKCEKLPVVIFKSIQYEISDID